MGNYYLYKIAEFLTNLLPLSVNYALAVFLADCQYLLSKADRGAVRDNLKIILNTDEVPPLMVRKVFHYFGRYLVDFFIMTKRVNHDFIKNSVKITNIECLNRVLNEGKGGVIIGAHLGNWEIAGAILGLLGYPLSVVALAHKDDRVNTFFNQKREFFGATVIQTNVALRRCLEHLRRNRLVAMLADRDFGHHGLKMQFFGKNAFMPKGAAIFSLKTGAPLIPMNFLRKENNQFQFEIGEPIYPPALEESNVNDKEIEKLIGKYIGHIEEEIRQNPSQWLVFRRFEVE
jgi:KDO2-lipid IV(A) lauroyltransferase